MKPESISFRLIGEAINDLLTWLAEDRFAAGVVVGGAIGIVGTLAGAYVALEWLS